ncbi:MAG TPA: thymidylate synthase [Patescibacteria group bacterium]|nr:thymidylate synthase [Patescibacteria group bacterium]
MKKYEIKYPYFSQNLIEGFDWISNTGVATLWTEKERMFAGFDRGTFAVIGQLYSKNGINPLLRNILANPSIRYIVLCGKELSGSGQNLINFFQNGVDEEYNIIGSKDAKVDKEIPLEYLELVRANIEVVDLRDEIDPKKVNKKLKALKSGLPAFTERIIFPEAQAKADVFPSEISGINVRGNTVRECWIKIVRLIRYYGFVKESQHGDPQKELVGFTTVITGEDPDNIDWFSEFTRTTEELLKYYPQVLTPDPIEGVHYTYGQRLRDHDGIDQIESMIDQLKGAIYSRRAVACTWRVAEDHNNSNSPCLDLVQALVQGKKLYLTAYFRSNDMYRAWPENAFALRKLQKMIADGVECELGDLVIISNSSHIYKQNWNDADRLVEKYGREVKCSFDPRGNFIILLDRDKKEIIVEHQSPAGLPLRQHRAKNAMEMFGILYTHDSISDTLHALDVGAELQKAEIALIKGIDYIQDRDLEI